MILWNRVVERNLQLFLMRNYCTGFYDEVAFTGVGFEDPGEQF